MAYGWRHRAYKVGRAFISRHVASDSQRARAVFCLSVIYDGCCCPMTDPFIRLLKINSCKGKRTLKDARTRIIIQRKAIKHEHVTGWQNKKKETVINEDLT